MEFKGFYELLCESINKNRNGMYEEIIKYSPSFFKLLCNILNDKRTDWHTRLVINSALGYFVVPHDIIPEDEYGNVGYVDDVLLCSYVLREIKNKVSEELLIDNWKEEGNILEIVDEIFSKSKKITGNKYSKILQFVGLKKEGNNIPTLSVKRKGRDVDNQKLLHEKQELIGLLAYITKIVYLQPPKRKIKNLIEYIKSQEQYKEIEKILSKLDE